MPRLPQVTGEELVRGLRRAGFTAKRWHGSHAILDDGQRTLAALLRGAGLTAEELLRLL